MVPPTSALAPLRVLDFSRVLAGPFATMLLADLDAEVTKVERPGMGDDTRAWGPPYDHRGTATYFLAVNRNKTGMVFDLADPDDPRPRPRRRGRRAGGRWRWSWSWSWSWSWRTFVLA
jgi:crotonobetainyl-CoA:carnitine CoA-transferase CaiB-like acyl-CoA transferase